MTHGVCQCLKWLYNCLLAQVQKESESHLHFWEEEHGVILSSSSWGIWGDGQFHMTFRRYLSGGTHPSKLHYCSGLLHATLKSPTTTREPERFILGTKCQKARSLEAFKVFAFLSSCYCSVQSWGLVLYLKKKAKIVVLNTLPTAFLLPLLRPPGLPSPLCAKSAQVLQPISSIAATRRVGCFRQTLSLSYNLKKSEYLTRISIKQFLAKSEMLLPASSCDFWLLLTPHIHPNHWKLI